MDFDVIVVGGSAIGGAAAAECAKNGLKTAILEEDKHVGKYKRCTAFCSESGLKATKIPYKDAILNKVKGAVIHSPNKTAEIKMSKDRAIVFDRQKFDENSIDRALYYGAELFKEHRAVSFRSFSKFHYSVFAGKTFNSSIVVGADGVASHTAASFNFPSFDHVAYCHEKEITGVRVPHTDLVDVVIDNEKIPGFFGWCVPVDEKTVRVGFGTTRLNHLVQAKKYFFSYSNSPSSNSFSSLSFLKSKSAKTLRQFYAAIPLGPRKRIQIDNVLLVGDAAGQTKATTGGGLVFGSLAAQIAGETIAEHLFNNKKLEYEKRWRKEYNSILMLHKLTRKLVDASSNSMLDFYVSLLSFSPVNKMLSKFGDMDFIFKYNK